ncbi:hypothetical protein SAMN05444673_6617 [Bacillus sp. OV166]|jgi:hypothetical protein|uniref:hypothetical protein n=1 Tax=Bacillus sp. OV166 TaxID=1882763 RepID=UPI000A2AEEBD|nr:hypothetical protein [Bacillus sp. OV166]SMQ86620.1 hypothetical protein SAMN05444673_6617 [Bacillus sp. OV166]
MNDIKLILSEEIGRLIDELYKCKNETLKEEILKEILQLNDAIMLSNDYDF